MKRNFAILLMTSAIVVVAVLSLTLNQVGQKGTLEGTVNYEGLACPPNNFKIPPCSGPYPNYEVVIYKNDNQTIVAQTRSDAGGHYKIELDKGSYVIKVKSNQFNKAIETLTQVTIEPNKNTKFNINIISGIR